MKTTIHQSLVTIHVLLVSASVLFAQGSLTPPAGPPAPTMKTLVEVEPRIAINATNTPGDADSLFKITQPGSYYLTGNITGVAGKSGIEIAVAADGPGVTIDLMGFELAGALGSLDGIAATVPSTRNTAIRNGTVRAWSGDGIDISNSQNNRLADLRAQGNGGILNGIRIGSNSRVTDNTCDANGFGAGLFSGIFTLGDRNRIEGNNVTNNDFGIGVGGDGHLIIRNYAGANATNYSLPPSGSFIGTIVGTSAGMNAAENANVNISN